jgi:putative GTP pyrophosphokinase
MSIETAERWLDHALPKHQRLTSAVVSILDSLLKDQAIDFLAVSGRTKSKKTAIEKIGRKGYSEPARQLTDLSGIRVVVFFESDVRRVAQLVEGAFAVDRANSLDKDNLLSANQIGYRSVHFVCDLGENRSKVEEYKNLANLKFEIQIRTVLQHAWAELAHDRNYKFSGKLPKELERKLFLYAGLLEIADQGFNETSRAIDEYSENLQTRTSRGDFDIEITSLSLDAFVGLWASRTGYEFELSSRGDLGDLVEELRQFGVSTLAELDEIVPKDYVKVASEFKESTSTHGVVRDWMLIKDWRRFVRDVHFSWVMDEGFVLARLMNKEDFSEMMAYFRANEEVDEAP